MTDSTIAASEAGGRVRFERRRSRSAVVVRRIEKGAFFRVSARSLDDFNTDLMEWIPGKEQEMARYKDPARSGHDITFMTKDRLLRAVGNELENMHYTMATEPERTDSPETHLLILLGRKRECVADAAMQILAPDSLVLLKPAEDARRAATGGSFTGEVRSGSRCRSPLAAQPERSSRRLTR
jgi:hypothetical protein